MVVFEYLSLQNVLSFGNKETIVNFTKGLTFITGENGVGKSTILDGLSFCLYGRPYRDIVIKSLINWVNKKNLKTECKFRIDNDTYIITRTLSPDSITILKNDSLLDLRASKTLVQEEIDKILGVNYKLFKQIISLAINYNKSFLTMNPAEKREVLEQLFNIKVFSDMLKDIKKESVEIKHENEVIVKSYGVMGDGISSLKHRYEELVYLKTNFEDSKTDQLNKLNAKLNDYTNKKSGVLIDLDKLNEDIEQYRSRMNSNIVERYDSFMSTIMNPLKYEANNIKTILNNLKNNTSTECEYCCKPMTKAYIDKEISKKAALFEEVKAKSEVAMRRYTRLTNLKAGYAKIAEDYRRSIGGKSSIESQVKFFDSEIKGLELDIIEITNKVFDANIDSLKAEIENKATEYNSLSGKIKSFNESLKINSIIADVLSDGGIKSYFMSKIIPVLNNNINDYLKMFDLPLRIKFSDSMEASIINFRNPTKEIDFNAFSEGQKKRIDLAILFSFISVVKNVCNWNCNLFMIDELLDTSIDEKGLEKILDIINDMIKEYQTCVYIISHRIQNSVTADRSIRISTNSNGFAELEIS